MSQPRTTIILIVLAGDEDTAKTLDPVLYEIQTGINRWPDGEPPLVYCMYYRCEPTGGPKTYQFEIAKCTLQFTGQLLDTTAYPPTGSTLLTGPIADQVTEFLTYVSGKLPHDGPIRSVVAAHGAAAIGFKPTTLLELLNLLLQLLHNMLEASLAQQLRALLAQGEIAGSPPGGFAATVKSDDPDLTLTHASVALDVLPCDRLRTLVLHACDMSGLETISALEDVPHHIACETSLFWNMHFSDWFPTFGDPTSTCDEVTLRCFKSLTSGDSRNANGCFSSHYTSRIGDILIALNSLGAYLNTAITCPDPDDTLQDIANARGASEVSIFTVDIARFCRALAKVGVIPTRLSRPIIDGIYAMQLGPPIKTNDWRLSTDFDLYRGISVYLPNRRTTGIARTTADLPQSFQDAAPCWCEFVDRWIKG